jgi:hypothetical protein
MQGPTYRRRFLDMRRSAKGITAVAVALASVSFAGAAAAQQTSVAHTHMGHVADGFSDTPEGKGLLPTAQAEAAIAVQHAGFAARDLEDLDAMKLHAGHVLHAVDPTAIDKGPGLGYGLQKAANGVVRHIELAASADDASDNVKTHAVHVATAARNVAQWAGEMADLAKRIRAASSAAEAAPLVTHMKQLADQVVSGVDANGDGRITWEKGEGGLEQAAMHMGLMKKGEGMGM